MHDRCEECIERKRYQQQERVREYGRSHVSEHGISENDACHRQEGRAENRASLCNYLTNCLGYERKTRR